MTIFFTKSKYLGQSAVVLLLVGALAGVTVGGGVGVFAASSAKSVTVCVDKEDSHMNYSRNGKCKSHQFKLILNQNGAPGTAGTNGLNGTNGTNGAKGDAGAAGAKGDAGAAGAKGDAGAAGAKGDAGAAGAKGDTGDTGASGTSSPIGFTARSVCDGSDSDNVADELCAVGMKGPAGGYIFFIDTENELVDYDYLEVAPTHANFASVPFGKWSTNANFCGTLRNENCQTTFLSDLGSSFDYLAVGTGRAATAKINARVLEGGDNNYAAYRTSKSNFASYVASLALYVKDYWLPSIRELELIDTNLVAPGLAPGLLYGDVYWSSSEASATNAWSHVFSNGSTTSQFKSANNWVLPIRGF